MIAKRGGFTIIELLVVIAVIGILATIGVVSFWRYQADARDAQREARIGIIAEALEKYYDSHGEYPGCTALQQSVNTVTASVLPGVEASALTAPLSPTSDANSVQCQILSIDGTDFFEYGGDTSSDCISGSACLAYTLKYKSESTGTIKELDSRRNGAIDTSGSLTLSGSTLSQASVSVNWNTITNTTGYIIQRDTSNTFSSGNLISVTVDADTTSHTASGLLASTTYYFRVAALAAPTQQGSWSNVLPLTTLDISAPTLTATPTSFTQIDTGWTTISGATAYVIQRSTGSSFADGTYTEWTLGSGVTTRSFTDSVTGTLYYFRVRATIGASIGTWSSTVSANTLSAPESPHRFSLAGTFSTATVTSHAVCINGAVTEYAWFIDDDPWVQGDEYEEASYTPAYGQTIVVTHSARCHTPDNAYYSSWTPAQNSLSFTRQGLTILGIQKVNGGVSNGHRVHTWWNDLCGGSNQIIGHQGSFDTGWISPSWNAAGNPAAGASAMPGATHDVRNWSSGGTVTMYARQNCGGWQQSSNAGSIYA